MRTAIVDDDDRFISDMQEAKTALKVLLPSPRSCLCKVIDVPAIQAWEDSLPEHLRYTEENLHIMNSMYETPANTGAWCFFYMHSLHSCCEMSAFSVCLSIVPPAVFRHSALTDCCLRYFIPLGNAGTIWSWKVYRAEAGLRRRGPLSADTQVCGLAGEELELSR